MQDYQKRFIELTISQEALRFGDFTLKSKRQSPYFFNLGQMNTGAAMAAVGQAFAHRLSESSLAFDGLFGPAYKGIPIVTATAMMMQLEYQRTVPFTFNRKEAKDHGEGGQLVGAPLEGNIVLLDDVITAGTAIDECLPMIEASGATLTGIVLALNRQEKGKDGHLSAVTEVSQRIGVPIISIITLTDIATYLKAQGDNDKCAAIDAYRHEWGAD
jgi:orotate phosphoribosyltransferase